MQPFEGDLLEVLDLEAERGARRPPVLEVLLADALEMEHFS